MQAVDEFEDEVNALDDQIRELHTKLNAASKNLGQTAAAVASATKAMADGGTYL